MRPTSAGPGGRTVMGCSAGAPSIAGLERVDIPVCLFRVESQQTVDLLERQNLLAVDDAIGSGCGNREFREELALADVDAFQPAHDPGGARLLGDEPLQVGAQATGLLRVEVHRSLEMFL